VASPVGPTGAFARAELVSTLRQPRLLVVLVLGPFLVLFLFGLGYDHDLPTLSTIVVGAEDDDLTAEVDDFIRTEQPAGIDYQGTETDRDRAIEALRADEVDLVVILPDRPMEEIGRSERATIEIHQRSLDPVTFSQIAVAADSAINQINNAVVESFLTTAQERTEGVEGQLDQAREELEQVRGAIDDADLAQVQRMAGQLSGQLESLADQLESGAGLAGRLGLGSGDVDDAIARLRSGAAQLDTLSEIDGAARLDEAADTLAEIDEAVTQLRGIDPAVAVRPFQAQVISQTPEVVTLDRFYAPGLLALMIQHLGITFAALALVRERETGTIQLLHVSPTTVGERLAGKTLAFLLLGGATAAVLTALLVLVFDVPLPSRWLAFSVLVALALLASLGIGYVVAAVSQTHSQAVQLSMLLFLTAIFFSGLFMPLDRIEMPVELVSWLLPATYAFEGAQDLMLLGEPTRLWLYAGLLGITVVTFGIARVLLPRRAAASV
jgi:ABC-2 type transport system permease protein